MTDPVTRKDPALSRRLKDVKHIILVLSGKGGVGKSSVSVQLALSLLKGQRGNGVQVGLLDIDLTGPSIPRMLGLEGRSVLQSTDGWIPVQTEFNDNQNPQHQKALLKCMSIGFLLKHPKDSVVWRGPKKNAMIRQFLVDVRWGELDYLVIDTPPGTSDEHISLIEQLSPLLLHQSGSSSTSENLPTLSSVLVTTPQAVSLLDVSKEYDFTKKTSLKVIGLIENMSGYLCPHCNQIQNLFGSGGGLSFCQKVSTQASQQKDQDPDRDQPRQTELKFLGKIPIDVEFMKLMDQANNLNPSSEPLVTSTNPDPPTLVQNSDLIKRYLATESSKVFGPICDQIVQAIHQPTIS